MNHSRTDRYISWMLGAIAGVSIGISILDVIGIAPGWAAKLTPFFVGVLLLYVVLERDRMDSIKYIVRRLDRSLASIRRSTRSSAQPKKYVKEAEPSSYRSIPWKGLTFRSNTEVRIAKALDQYDLFYYGPAKSRLTIRKERETREIDFLIFHNGRWGILEVDGPHHNVAYDQARDEHLRAHGILVIERFDADACYHNPQGVVNTFLERMGTVEPKPAD